MNGNWKYPLRLTFKIFAIASQVYIRDADGNLSGFVKQKGFKLKEQIHVFRDESRSEIRYSINADRILDISANYSFTNSLGAKVGSIKRKGMRSLWKADYEISSPSGELVMKLNEDSAWTRLGDVLIGELPIVGIFTGYFFNPTYLISRIDGEPLMKLIKQPAFLEGRFIMETVGGMSESEEELAFLSGLTMLLLERFRG